MISFGHPITKRFLLLASIVTLLLLIYHVEYRSTRIATLAGLFVTYGCLLILSWKIKPLRIILISTGIVPIIAFCLPARNPDPSPSATVTSSSSAPSIALAIFGEVNPTSALIAPDSSSNRSLKPLIFANLAHGLRNLDGQSIRTAYSLWWHDASALALRDRYRSWTVEIGRAAALNTADHSPLQPGDLAVTSDGLHILAYLGNDTWIEADPNFDRVIHVTVPTENPWFNVPVILMRWRTLM